MLVIFSVMFLAPFSLLAQFDFPTMFGDNLALTAGIVAFVMPPLIDMINRRGWSSEAKATSAFVSCIVASLLLVWAMGQLEGVDVSRLDGAIWMRTIMIVFVGAIALHRWFWKPSGISDAIAKATG